MLSTETLGALLAQKLQLHLNAAKAYQGADGPVDVAFSCSNVKGVAYGKQQPPSCV